MQDSFVTVVQSNYSEIHYRRGVWALRNQMLTVTGPFLFNSDTHGIFSPPDLSGGFDMIIIWRPPEGNCRSTSILCESPSISLLPDKLNLTYYGDRGL